MVTPSDHKLSLQKFKTYDEFSKIVQWGRQNPIAFVEHMFGIKLMDFQKYIFMETWTKPFNVWLMCRGAGKTALMAVYLMTRMLLFPNWNVYVAATTHPQARRSFKKLEDIAMGREPSFKDATDIFLHEMITNHGNERFKHGADGYTFSLYNDSSLGTLSSNEDGVRGLRGSVWMDEAAFMSHNYIAVVDQFINVDKSYSLAVNDMGYKDPQAMPLQLIYTSSAGPASFPFYDKFKTFSKHMIAGDSSYFACNIDVNFLLEHTTVDGVSRPSHINEVQVKSQIRDHPDAAERELFNHFMTGGGKNAVVPQDVLVRNSRVCPPVLHNDTGKRKFIFGYDPARNYDNSILAIMEVIDDPKLGYIGHMVNVISMVDERKAQKTPLPMNKQIEVLRDVMLKYNGDRAAEWENIQIFADAGSGGGPRSGIFDHMMSPYTDAMGIEHRGIIDPIDKQYEEDRYQYRDAAQIVHLMEPTKYKAKMFGALEEVSALNLIKFTNYDMHSDALLIEDDSASGYSEYILTTEEKDALVQLELMKTEINYMVRIESPATRKVQYELVRERQKSMHDDRAYALALCAYGLWEMRNKDLRERKKEDTGPILAMRAPDLYGRSKSHRTGSNRMVQRGRSI